MIVNFQLAYKNLVNAGLRTWLNVGVLSFVFIVVLGFRGFIEGWSKDAERDAIEWEYAQGQLHHPDYEPTDALTIRDAHGIITDYSQKNLLPVLIRPASIYPKGRFTNIALKGIPMEQKVIALPTEVLGRSEAAIPAIIGSRMAKSTGLRVGDNVLIRWRDKYGTFDAGNITIVEIFGTNVGSVDQGQIWIPIQSLWQMTGMQDEATIYLLDATSSIDTVGQWKLQTQDDLLSDIRTLIAVESFSTSIMYLILLSIALLAIFDTQVLSIFRRQREIGTLIALGMTNQQVTLLFTIEGAMYSFFATIVGSIIGIPLLLYISTIGISYGDIIDDMGIGMASTIYPTFSLTVLIQTVIIIVSSATLVSYIPARKIAIMSPILALKGKQQ
jgi:ABC-type lipoprotein release transport system permease subunit